MMNKSLESRALKYAQTFGINLNFEKPLGFGNDGHVWRSSQNTAVKTFRLERAYRSEATCYRRLTNAGVFKISGLVIPKMIHSDDALMIVEMEVVSAPFLLDFGKVWIDKPPDYTQETWDDWDARGREEFGDRWDEAKSAVWGLRKFGIYYTDIRPGNVNFGTAPKP